jgi:hypothetical protein
MGSWEVQEEEEYQENLGVYSLVGVVGLWDMEME